MPWGVLELSPLAGLTNLEYLEIEADNKFHNIDFLASLTRLCCLIINGLPSKDLGFLLTEDLSGARFPDLERFEFEGTVGTLEPLAKLTSLTSLKIRSFRTQRLGWILPEYLQHVTDLTFQSATLNSHVIRAIGQMHRLRRIDLSLSRYRDPLNFRDFQELVNLEDLEFRS